MKARSMVCLVVLGGAIAWANSSSADIVAQYAGPATFDDGIAPVALDNVSIGQQGRVDLQFKPDNIGYDSGAWGTLWCLQDVPGGNLGQYRLQVSNSQIRVAMYSGAGGYAVLQTVAFTPTQVWHTASLEWEQGQSTLLTVDGTNTAFTNAYDLLAFTSTTGTRNDHVIGASTSDSYWPGTAYFHGQIENVVVQNTYSTTPEPSALVLLATGLFALLAYAWRKRK